MDVIRTRVESGADNYLKKFGAKPSKIYLGEIEFKEFSDFAKKNSDYEMKPVKDDEAKRTEYYGMKIYKVDAENYLAYGN